MYVCGWKLIYDTLNMTSLYMRFNLPAHTNDKVREYQLNIEDNFDAFNWKVCVSFDMCCIEEVFFNLIILA